MEEGLRLFLKERNNMVAGRKVELVVADTAGKRGYVETRLFGRVLLEDVSGTDVLSGDRVAPLELGPYGFAWVRPDP